MILLLWSCAALAAPALDEALAATEDEPAVAELIEEIVDRYGPAPVQLETLARAQQIRIAAQRIGVTAVQRRSGRWRLRLDPAAAALESVNTVSWDGDELVTRQLLLPDPLGGEQRVADLRGLRDRMDPEEYDRELETLLVDLALKSCCS